MFSISVTSVPESLPYQVSWERCIEGTSMTDIVFDSGDSRTMVRLDLVPQGKLVESEVLIKCAHGDHFKYPRMEKEVI